MPLGFSSFGSSTLGASIESVLQPIPAIPAVTGITISPSSVILIDGESQDFDVTVSGDGDYDPSVIWSTPYGTISSTGFLTLPSVGIERIFEIQAKSVSDPTKVGIATVTQLANMDFIVVAPSRKLRTQAGNTSIREGAFDPNGDTFYLSQGYWAIDKDVDESLYYSLDVGPDLDAAYTEIDSVLGIPLGVTLDGAVKVQGTELVMKVGGGDISDSPDATNSVTLRVTCANGEIFDRTIYFPIRDK